MKKSAVLLFTTTLLLLSIKGSAYDGIKLTALPNKNHPFTLKTAEEEEGMKGKIIITAGVGLNLVGTSLELRYLASNYYDYGDILTGHQSSPMYNLAVDYGFHEKFSVGAAFGYQTIRMNFKDAGPNLEDYHDTWTRLHFAVRADYYIVSNKEINLYTGVKLGYNIFTVTTTIPKSLEPNYYENMGVYPNPVSAQAHFGFSYFVNGAVGVNAEIGVGYGGPYLVAVGATVKL